MSIFQFPSFTGSNSKLSYGSSLLRGQTKYSPGLQKHSPSHLYSQLSRVRSLDKTNFFPSSTGSLDQRFPQTYFSRPSPWAQSDLPKPNSFSRMNLQLYSQPKNSVNKPSSPVAQLHQTQFTRHKSFEKPQTSRVGQLRAESGLERLLQRKKQLDRRVKEILQNIPEIKRELLPRPSGITEEAKASEPSEVRPRQSRKFSGLEDLKLSSQLGETMLRK